MEYISTPAAVEFAKSMDIQSGSGLYVVFEGFRHRGIALDANLRAAFDGFTRETRDRVLYMLLHRADGRHIKAAFTREDVYPEKFHTVYGRKLMLWQDSTDDIRTLYVAANSAQWILLNLGYNQYVADLMAENLRMHSKKKRSFFQSIKDAINGIRGHTDDGLSGETDKLSDQHTGKWKHTIPYFLGLGQSLDLIPPQNLVSLSSKIAVDNAITNNTVNATYQQLRGTEVILMQAINFALPESLKDDKNLRFLLDRGYIEESLQQLFDKEKIVFNGDDSPYQKRVDVELSRTTRAVLYAALYRGARQRIEDASLQHTAYLIYDLAYNGTGKLVYQVSRDYDRSMPENGYQLYAEAQNACQQCNESVQEIARHIPILKIPIHITEDITNLVVTGWPDLCDNVRNCMNPDTAFTLSEHMDLASMKVRTPIDAIALNMSGDMGIMRSDYAKGMESDIRDSIQHITESAGASRKTKLKA